MTDLVPSFEFVPAYIRSQEIIEKMGGAVVSKHAFRTQFIGHETYQIEKFIINDKEYPTNDSKYRQVCRELWARMEAAITNRYNYEKAAAEMALLEDERDRLRMRFWRSARWRSARARILTLDIENRRAVRAQLQLTFERGILRESETLLAILAGLQPPDDDHLKQQEQVWTMRGETNPKVREAVGGKK